MFKEVVRTKNAPAAPAYTSQAIVYNGLVHCSGNVALKDAAFEIIAGGIRTETVSIGVMKKLLLH
jgi:enamine deaminase RidA (YjgF/YER057c/UK114 family)